MRALWLLVALSACGPQYSSRLVCDAAQQERVFLDCMKSLQVPSTLAASGNDTDEFVDACRDAARDVACNRWERYCYENCERAP